MEQQILFLADLAGSTVCIDPQKALPVFEALLKVLQSGGTAVLSFDRVTRVITAFLNIAIGKLYDPKLKLPVNVDEALQFEGADEDTRIKLAQVAKYAKIFYSDPRLLQEIVDGED